MADEINTPNHRYYRLQNHIKLAESDMCKSLIFASGIRKIDDKIILPLFASAEPGTWFDPSDLTTLFQDDAGTTPVTTPGQTVGLMLDKSQGLVLGSELWSDTGVTVGTGWTAASGVYTHTVGVDTFRKDIGLVAGKTYQVTFTVTGRTAGNIGPVYGGSVSGPTVTANGTYTQRVANGTNALLYFQPSIDFVGSVSGISVKLLAGNHATQATLAQQPIYGINPIVGTRNLLTYTEAFTNATWLTQGGSWSAVDANGFQTFTEDTATSQHRLYDDAYSVVSGQAYTLSAQVAYGTRRWVFLAFYDGVTTVTAWFDLLNGVKGSVTAGATSTMTTVSSGVYNITLTRTAGATNSAANVQIGPQSADGETVGWTGTGATTRIAKYQFELGSTATAYQKVVSQYEVTEDGVQSVSYLAFDGVDDGMVTNTITPGIDKAQVFAGVRKLSDAAQGQVCETGPNVGTNNGGFRLFAPNTAGNANYLFISKGTLPGSSTVTNIAYAAPVTNILTGLGDISGDYVNLRINGSDNIGGAADQGTGDFLANPLYIGRRITPAAPFNGRIYSLITRFGPNLTTGQITSTESWVNAKVGAY